MKRFIVLPRLLSLGLLLGGVLVSGSPVFAQQTEKDATTVDVTNEDGKIKIVKVIDGKTTVEEYDASEMKGKMIWVEKDEEVDGDGKTEKHIIRFDGKDGEENVFEFKTEGGEGEEPHIVIIKDGEVIKGDDAMHQHMLHLDDDHKGKKVIKIEIDEEGGDHPQMIMIDEDMNFGGDGTEKNVIIKKEVVRKGPKDGKVQVHTIKIVNGDTVLNDLSEDEEIVIWQKNAGDGGEGEHIMIMHDEDGENIEKEVDVKVISDGKKEYRYEMIVVRSCKSVKMEEPAAAELEKLGEQGQANSLDVKKLEAFPSPNEGRFTVRFQLKDKNTPANLGIFNLEGQEVYQEKFSGSKNYEKQIDLGDVPAGVYLLRITQGEESMTRKLVIE